MVASSGEDSASDAHYGPTTTMRRRRCLRRRMHAQALRRNSSTEKNPTEAPSSNWPFWWLGAAAIAVFVTPGLSSAILNPELSMHDMAMSRLWASYGEEQRWWMDRNREDKMIFTPNYDDEHFFDAFKKPRPQGVRYRDDATLHRIAMQRHLQMQNHHAYPVMVQERPRPDMMDQQQQGGESSSSGLREGPSLEDIDLIDVLWREDIEREKSGGASVAPGVGLHPSDQVERDLQLLTEKSVQAPLTLEESSRYEDLSKVYFEDFYSNRRFAGEFSASDKSVLRGSTSASSSSSCSPTSSSASSSSLTSSRGGAFADASSTSASAVHEQRSRASSGATAAAADEEDVKPRTPIFDLEAEDLFEDIGKPCGVLNMLMPTEGAGMECPINTAAGAMAPPTTQPQPQLQQSQTVVGYTGPMPTADTLLQNVSLATIAPYNPANLTELDFMVRDGTLPGAASQMVLPPLGESLAAPNGTNGFPAPTQFWFESAPDGTASYQSRQPVLNMSTLQLPPLIGLGEGLGVDLQQAAAAAAAAAADDINMPPAHHELTTLTGRMPVYETRPSVRTASMSSTNDTQSLGAASSSSSSSSSPRYSSTSTQGGAGSDGENRSPSSRFYGKLAPPAPLRASANSISLFDDDEDDGDATSFFRSPSTGASLHAHSGGLNSAVAPRRRGRQSKDEQLAATNGLPVSAAEIADMSLPDLQKLLKADSLTEPQRQLIRKIRRRGKNKVAARTCRQRRGVARTEHMGGYEVNSPRILGYSNRH